MRSLCYAYLCPWHLRRSSWGACLRENLRKILPKHMRCICDAYEVHMNRRRRRRESEAIEGEDSIRSDIRLAYAKQCLSMLLPCAFVRMSRWRRQTDLQSAYAQHMLLPWVMSIIARLIFVTSLDSRFDAHSNRTLVNWLTLSSFGSVLLLHLL